MSSTKPIVLLVTAQSTATGMVDAFLLERSVPATLSRRVRGHFKQLYQCRGSVMDIADVMAQMPYTLRLELGASLGFLDDPNPRRRSVVNRVPFFQELGSEDLLRIGCKLQFVTPPEPITDDTTGELHHSCYIMREGDRGDEMCE